MRSVIILSKWDTVAGNEQSSLACLMLLDMYRDVAEVSAKKDLSKKKKKKNPNYLHASATRDMKLSVCSTFL